MSDNDSDAASSIATTSEGRLLKLKSSKAKAKSKFTRIRHRLIWLLDDKEVVPRTDIRKQQALLMDAEEQAIATMEN
jgi:hypothetical protein